MTEVWPLNVSRKLAETATDAMRPFRCLLLMPFHESFNEVTEIIRDTVSQVLAQFQDLPGPPVIDRLDWVTSAGAIQQQIWQKVFEADLVFCDITDYNPNVMFESGVCAAWKETGQVVLIKNHFCRTESPFDIKPMRYIEYELAYTGIKSFKEKLSALIREAIIRFPDSQQSSSRITLPYEKDFSDSRDDLAITTPPFAHRRVKDGALEFGSLWVYSHSWASVGTERFNNFSVVGSFRFPQA